MTRRVRWWAAIAGVSIALSACGGGGGHEPPPRPRPVHNDNEHQDHDEQEHGEPAAHGVRPLAALGSPLIHKTGAQHTVVSIRLASESEARLAPAPRFPLAQLGSLLVIAGDAPHHHEPVRMIHEGGPKPAYDPPSGPARGTPVTQQRAPVASPTPGPIDVSLRGTIARVDGRTIVLKMGQAERSVNVPVSTRYLQDVDGALSDLEMGDFASVVKRPDGTARSVRVYPRGMPTPETGLEPLTGADQGMVMLTGVVTGIYPGTMVIAAEGQIFPLTVTSATRVVKAAPASPTELSVGKLISIKAVQQPNGTTTATAVHLADNPGSVVTPPRVPASPVASPSAR